MLFQFSFGGGFGGYGGGYYGSGYISELLYVLQDLGILDIILPFILIFTIIFGILQKTGIFVKTDKDGKMDTNSMLYARKFNAIIALCISLITVIPHALGLYPADGDIIIMINQFIPEFSVAAIGIIMMLMVLGIGSTKLPNNISKVISIASLFVVIFLIYRAINYNYLPDWLGPLSDDPYLVMFLVILLTMGLIVRSIMSPPDNPSQTNTKGALTKFLEGVLGE